MKTRKVIIITVTTIFVVFILIYSFLAYQGMMAGKAIINTVNHLIKEQDFLDSVKPELDSIIIQEVK